MNIEEIRLYLDEIEKILEKQGIRLDALEASDMEQNNTMRSIHENIQETNTIVKSMSNNLGNDPDTGLPNTLCGLFAKVNAALNRYEERDQQQVEEIKKLEGMIKNLTKAVDSKTWIRGLTEKITIQGVGLFVTIVTALSLALISPLIDNNKHTTPKEKISRLE